MPSQGISSTNTRTRDGVPDDENFSTIGARIRHARKERALNQEVLATTLGVSQPTVANWEADVHNPRQPMMAKLADALDVSIEWLSRGDSPMGLPPGHPALSYLSRPLVHVPVLPASALMRAAPALDDLTGRAIDYVALSCAGEALIGTYPANADPFDPETLIVVDLARQDTEEAGWGLGRGDRGLTVFAWTGATPPVDPSTGRPFRVIGTVIAALRLF